MFNNSSAFSGFSVDNIETAKQFYSSTLGLTLEEQPNMGFMLKFPNGQRVFVYAKPDHQPASFTILNFPVADIDAAVAELTSNCVSFEQFDNPKMPQDDKGVLRGRSVNMGPDIAWFKDPAGNILAVLQN